MTIPRQILLLLVDVHSKWTEIYEMVSTTVECTITILQQVFASYSLPEQLVSDIGLQLTSQELADFAKMMASNAFPLLHIILHRMKQLNSSACSDFQAGHASGITRWPPFITSCRMS